MRGETLSMTCSMFSAEVFLKELLYFMKPFKKALFAACDLCYGFHGGTLL
jgi:hypothetical protein